MPASEAPEPFAARLRRLREQAGLSAYALARKAGITKQSYSALEAGKARPAGHTLDALARALGKKLRAWEGCSF